MEIKFYLYLLLSLQLVFNGISAGASVKPALDADSKISLLNSYREQLKNHNLRFKELKSSLEQLEENISSQNNRYITGLNITQKVGAKVESMESELQEREKSIKTNYQNSKKILLSYFANKIDSESTSENILQRKVLKKLLVSHLSDLNKNIEQNKDLRNKIDLLKSRTSEYKAVEKTLYTLVIDLENQKKNLVTNYFKVVNEKKVVEIEISKIKAELAKTKTDPIEGSDTFFPPLAKYKAYKTGKKGINFTYSGIVPVLAVSAGKIVYSGELASYGNVLMVDHGNDLRSVFLGRFAPEVQKGDVVDRGAVIAYTKDSVAGSDTLYFEVRKKNQSQNTLVWLDKKTLQKYRL